MSPSHRGSLFARASLLSPKYGWGRIDVFDSVRQFGCGARLAWDWGWRN